MLLPTENVWTYSAYIYRKTLISFTVTNSSCFGLPLVMSQVSLLHLYNTGPLCAYFLYIAFWKIQCCVVGLGFFKMRTVCFVCVDKTTSGVTDKCFTNYLAVF